MRIIFSILFCLMTSFAYSQNVVSIADSANTLVITYSDASENITFKRGCKITNPPTGTIIYLTDVNRKTYVLDWNLITSPVTANKNALALTIKNYID